MPDDISHRDEAPARTRDLGGAVQRLARSRESAPEIDAKLLKLINIAQANGQAAELLDALAAADIGIFSTMEAIQATLLLAESAARAAEFVEKFKTLHDKSATPPLWSFKDRKKVYGKQVRSAAADRTLIRHLLSAKYAQGPAAFANLKRAAAHYATRLDLPEALIDGLREHSEFKTSSREEFARRLKEGFVFEHVLNDLPRRGANRDVAIPLVKSPAEHDWLEGTLVKPQEMNGDPPRPALFLTFHGSLFGSVKYWYKTVFPDGERIGFGSKTGKAVSSRDNANGALLDSYRSLMQGKSLLIAADSPMGTAKNLLHVLGREIPVADGFVFLAFESKADVYWLIVVEEEGRLVPRVVAGPHRAEGEKMPAYRERLIDFVERQITAYLTGDPQKIALGSKWIGLMSGQDTAYKERHYRPA